MTRRRLRARKRTTFRWTWCYVLSTGEEWPLGADQLADYRKIIERRKAEGKPYGSIWKRRVSYGPWRAT